MSLLTDHPNTIQCFAYFTEEANNSDVVYVSQQLWEALSDLKQEYGESSLAQISSGLAISIKFKKHTTSSNKRQKDGKLKYLVAWAEDPSRADFVPAHDIALSPKLRSTISALQGAPNSLGTKERPVRCTIAPIEPIKLSEVFAIAQSRASYSLAHSRKTDFQDWLLHRQRILRLNETVSFCLGGDSFVDAERNGHHYDFRISLTEPVAQGYAVKGDTRIILLRGSSHDENRTNGVNGINGHMPSPVGIGGSSDSQPFDEDELSIDENFLANSTLSVSRSFSTTSSSHLDSKEDETPSSLHGTRTTFEVHALAARLDDGGDDTCSVYMRTSDLSKIGVFDGDWVVTDRGDITNRRIVKVCAADYVVEPPDALLVSPLLRHNIHPESSSSNGDHTVTVNITPFGSGVPVIPTAKSATLTRIASPTSQTRSLQAALHHALKEYFSGSRRLVKKGDLIAVTFDTVTAAVYNELEEIAKEKEEGGVPDDLHTLIPQLGSSRHNAVAFFQVANLEYNVVANIEGSGHLTAASMGELGCWIDTSVTRMMQAGVEHSFVPHVGDYFDLGMSDHLDPSSTLPAYDKMLDFVTVCTQTDVAELGIKAAVILKGALQCGKRTTVRKVAQKLGLHTCEIDCYEIVSENANHTEGALRAHLEKAAACTPCILILRNIDALSQTTQPSEGQKEPKITLTLKELVTNIGKERQISGYPMVLVGTTTDVDKVPKSIRACFNREIECTVPAETQRLKTLQALLHDDVLGSDVSLKDVAMQTAALLTGDLRDLVRRARLSAIERATSGDTCIDKDVTYAGLVLLNKDFEQALSQVRASYSRSIGAPSIPAVTWDDVGGLANVKQEILDTVQLPLEHPELFAGGMKKRSGLLLYGPPGTGKTLLAKAVATSCSLNFLSVKGPELLNMYIGESEANVRRVFQRARDAKPCVIFFDELDSVAPKRGQHGDSGGVMDRIVSQLLAELDGMSGGEGEEGAEVFVIGATNRPDLLDPALLRPGRFDRMLYLGVSTTHETQLDILKALTRKFKLEPSLDLKAIADKCPFNYTGADFYALCSDAMLKAMSRVAATVDVKIAKLNESPLPGHPYPITPQYYLIEMAKPEEIEVLVSHEDFVAALGALVPSVSQSEMEHYAEVQQKFAGETINAVKKDKGKGKEKAIEIEFDSH